MRNKKFTYIYTLLAPVFSWVRLSTTKLNRDFLQKCRLIQAKVKFSLCTP